MAAFASFIFSENSIHRDFDWLYWIIGFEINEINISISHSRIEIKFRQAVWWLYYPGVLTKHSIVHLMILLTTKLISVKDVRSFDCQNRSSAIKHGLSL